MAAAMRLVASRRAPAVSWKDVKDESRHQAMTFVLAGIVASLVLTTFKVCSPLTIHCTSYCIFTIHLAIAVVQPLLL